MISGLFSQEYTKRKRLSNFENSCVLHSSSGNSIESIDLDNSQLETSRLVESEELGLQILSDQLKRTRLANTPGEIRLKSDLRDIEDNIRFLNCEVSLCSPTSVLVTFHSSFENSQLQSNSFQIHISKYYPHRQPLVFILDTGTGMSNELIHPRLNNWTPISCLKDLIFTLESIRRENSNSPNNSPIEGYNSEMDSRSVHSDSAVNGIESDLSSDDERDIAYIQDNEFVVDCICHDQLNENYNEMGESFMDI